MDTTPAPLAVTYDPDADAAYLALTGDDRPTVARTVHVAALDVLVDVAADGTLVGFEILDASTRLPATLLATADRPA